MTRMLNKETFRFMISMEINSQFNNLLNECIFTTGQSMSGLPLSKTCHKWTNYKTQHNHWRNAQCKTERFHCNSPPVLVQPKPHENKRVHAGHRWVTFELPLIRSWDLNSLRSLESCLERRRVAESTGEMPRAHESSLQVRWLGGGKSSLWRAREERAARRETGFQVVGNPEK